MKITCERSYLAEALAVVSRAVSSRNTLPILSNVLLQAQNDRLQLTATDLDTSIRSVLPAQIAVDGEVAVPANLLLSVVSKLKDAPVTLEAQDGKVSVRSGKSDYTVLSLPAEDFPVVPQVESGTEFSMPQGTLKEMLRLTTFAAAREETRGPLMGVLFEARGNTLTMVATDTHRLAWKQAEMADTAENPISVIVPASPLRDLERVLSNSNDDSVHIRFGRSQVQFETAGVTLVSRVLDGQFPPYEKVIPKNPERKITFDRATMLSAIQRVELVAKTNNERGVWQTKGDMLELTAESQEVGKAYEEVPIALEGSDITIAFNAGYLAQVLSIVQAEQMTLDLTGPLNPGILRGENDSDFLYVVMPMNI